MRQPIVAGNWKMNGSSESIRSLIAGLLEGQSKIGNAQVAVCPPAVYISLVRELLGSSAIGVGGQDVSDQASGAYTGQVAADMYKDLGCQYVIVGHSERRHGLGESNSYVAAKFEAAQKAGLIPILCLGELLEERESGKTEAVVNAQLDAVIQRVGILAMANSVIAYEPVWAIGTGRTASPEQAQEVHAFIRSRLAAMDAGIAEQVRIQYGGSMNAGNAAELMAQADIDGGLIGGASLKAEDFLTICAAAG
ncbi:MAG: triose-phosphate isomerase [Gammaproteobacteria bacterium]|jgi:triosephosphate isomerase